MEIQLPFSDPSADGVAIQNACAEVLLRGETLQNALDSIAQIHAKHPKVPIYAMSYASLVVANGVENFVKRAKNAGITGLIVPDLPFDSDEGLGRICAANGILNIPVVAPTMSQSRLQALRERHFECIYTTLRAGITGQETAISGDSLRFIENLGGFEGGVDCSGAKILAGFGITSAVQAAVLAGKVYAIVAGSVFVKIIAKGESSAALEALRTKAAELKGAL